MTPLEQRSLGTLLLSGAIFLWFNSRMLDGGQVADLSATGIVIVYLSVLAMTTLAYAGVAAFVALRNKGVARDERDALIEGKATRNELFAISAIVNIAVFQAIAHAYVPGYAPMFDLGHLPSLTYALLGGLWLGEFVRLISVLVYSRA